MGENRFNGFRVSPWAGRPWIMNERFARMRNEGGGFAEIDGSGRSCSGIRISHTTFLTAQDDEMGRGPKVVFSHQSLVTSH